MVINSPPPMCGKEKINGVSSHHLEKTLWGEEIPPTGKNMKCHLNSKGAFDS
jgi:hypothetical protein